MRLLTDISTDRSHEHTISAIGAEEISFLKSPAAVRGAILAILIGFAFVYAGWCHGEVGDVTDMIFRLVFIGLGVAVLFHGITETRSYFRVRTFCVIRQSGDIEIREDSGKRVLGKLVGLKTTTKQGVSTYDFPLYRLYAILNVRNLSETSFVLLYQLHRHQADNVDSLGEAVASFTGIHLEKVSPE